MGKPGVARRGATPHHRHHQAVRVCRAIAILAIVYGTTTTFLHSAWPRIIHQGDVTNVRSSPFGSFPRPDDPFQFVPCVSTSVSPPLEDKHPRKTWASLFDPNPDHWSWGATEVNGTAAGDHSHAGRGIYLCGWIDVPLDYENKSDNRIIRLAVNKYQVSGLALANSPSRDSDAGQKSERTLVLEPGGPGGSGTGYLWRTAEANTQRFSDGKFDVLAWDPRGVNASLPAISCWPYDADRDRWLLQQLQHYQASPSPRAQLEFTDAFYESMLRGCWERHGDLGRFMGTGLVARDLEEIRKALGEDELTGYLVSYGTGIGQTYVNMFPDSAGRLILDGTEYVRDHRLLGGFGWTALDNGTDAWHDGFLGECVTAGPEHCALAKPAVQGKNVTLEALETRMQSLIESTLKRPIPGYTVDNGPTLITYSQLVNNLYRVMYNPRTWKATAQMLAELESGNSTLAAAFVSTWQYDPTIPCPVSPAKPTSEELEFIVICADAWDAPQPVDGLDWWLELWANMSSRSWIAGNGRFDAVFPCRHFADFWPEPVGAYRGDLNHTLKHPVLLMAEPYDPATPLRNGRRLLQEMGRNARLIVHHGYGHSTRDTSSCTDAIAKAYILNGTLPEDPETACYADEKPYTYGLKSQGGFGALSATRASWDPIADWREHLRHVTHLN